MKFKALLLFSIFLSNNIFAQTQFKSIVRRPGIGLKTAGSAEKDYDLIVSDFYGELQFQLAEVDSAIKLPFFIGLFYAKKFDNNDIFKDKIETSVSNLLGSTDVIKRILKSIETETKLDNFVQGINNALQTDKILGLLKEKSITKDKYIEESLNNIKTFLKALEVSESQIDDSESPIKSNLEKLQESATPPPPPPATNPAVESSTDKLIDAIPKIVAALPTVMITILVLNNLRKGKITGTQAATDLMIASIDPMAAAPALAAQLSAAGHKEEANGVTSVMQDTTAAGEAGKLLAQGKKTEAAVKLMQRAAEKQNKLIEPNDPDLVESTDTAITVSKDVPESTKADALVRGSKGKISKDVATKIVQAKTPVAKPIADRIKDLQSEILQNRKLLQDQIRREGGTPSKAEITRQEKLKKLQKDLDALDQDKTRSDADRERDLERIRDEMGRP